MLGDFCRHFVAFKNVGKCRDGEVEIVGNTDEAENFILAVAVGMDEAVADAAACL